MNQTWTRRRSVGTLVLLAVMLFALIGSAAPARASEGNVYMLYCNLGEDAYITMYVHHGWSAADWYDLQTNNWTGWKGYLYCSTATCTVHQRAPLGTHQWLAVAGWDDSPYAVTYGGGKCVYTFASSPRPAG